MHERFGNIFDDNRNVIVPSSNGLVIRRSDKPSIFVYKGNGVDRSEMLIVFLNDFTRIDVVLSKKKFW